MPELIRQALRFGKAKNLGHLAERDFSSGLFAYWAKLFPVDDCCVGFFHRRSLAVASGT
jgi:hypothetical protein